MAFLGSSSSTAPWHWLLPQMLDHHQRKRKCAVASVTITKSTSHLLLYDKSHRDEIPRFSKWWSAKYLSLNSTKTKENQLPSTFHWCREGPDLKPPWHYHQCRSRLVLQHWNQHQKGAAVPPLLKSTKKKHSKDEAAGFRLPRWYSICTEADRKGIQTLINTAQKIIGCLLSLKSLHESRRTLSESSYTTAPTCLACWPEASTTGATKLEQADWKTVSSSKPLFHQTCTLNFSWFSNKTLFSSTPACGFNVKLLGNLSMQFSLPVLIFTVSNTFYWVTFFFFKSYTCVCLCTVRALVSIDCKCLMTIKVYKLYQMYERLKKRHGWWLLNALLFGCERCTNEVVFL